MATLAACRVVTLSHHGTWLCSLLALSRRLDDRARMAALPAAPPSLGHGLDDSKGRYATNIVVATLAVTRRPPVLAHSTDRVARCRHTSTDIQLHDDSEGFFLVSFAGQVSLGIE